MLVSRSWGLNPAPRNRTLALPTARSPDRVFFQLSQADRGAGRTAEAERAFRTYRRLAAAVVPRNR
jgi:hypothetical protein